MEFIKDTMSKKTQIKRTNRKRSRWKQKLIRYRELNEQIKEHASDILQSQNFGRTKEHIQHGNMTVNAHVLNVTRHSIALSEILRIKCNKRDLIRGALLHDYFLYDWHTPDEENPHKLHGFHHPKRALHNADKEYDLTAIQKDIIKKHMWPLTIVPPMCREAWIVTVADKWCSTLETLHLHKGHGTNLKK